MNVWNWTFELSSSSLLLASCNQYGLIVDFEKAWSKWKCHIPPIRRYGTEPLIKRLVMPWAFVHRLFRLGKQVAGSPSKKGGSQKKSVTMLDGVDTLEVREVPANQRCVEADAEDAHSPCPVTSETGHCEQPHRMTQHNFLLFPEQPLSPCWEGKSRLT